MIQIRKNNPSDVTEQRCEYDNGMKKKRNIKKIQIKIVFVRWTLKIRKKN